MPKVALVTGGLGGIGRAIVDILHARGDRVIIFDCVAPDHQSVRNCCQRGISYVRVDLADTTSIKQGFAQILEPTLDILVNNAGIAKDMLAVRMTEASWDAVLDVNLKGAFFCAQQALLRMIKQPKSYIINMSSVVGRTGNPGQAAYAASKAGIMALTKTLALEYASRNVLVNAIAPGFIDTAMTQTLSDPVKQQILNHIPLKRYGTPNDVAHVVAFLTSGCADYIVGQVIEVTGGM
ncbi:MAG: 3-oxoacyl-ACP reductase FabG [Candidatus Babeliales bacterium]|jgi:3-oxoacyl-[acyl-carrier protein] reductase